MGKNLEFTHVFGNEVIEWLYRIIVDKMFNDEETTYETMWKEFESDVDKLLKRFTATFGDAEYGKDMTTKLLDEINNVYLSRLKVDYLDHLEKATYLNPGQLSKLSNRIFYQIKEGKFDTHGIYKYITNMISYMKEIYSKALSR